MAQLLDAGSFAGGPVDLADGYIHLSAQDQVAGTLAKWFAGQDDLYLAAVDLTALGEAVKWEEARGGVLFPHIYADLPLSAVLAHGPLVWVAPGEPAFPALP
ncbi:MAG: DUF952 domain-containing protein [Sphingomonadales bacterium]|nr:DUF952 domain-containing protein [Sphingomonadales bacterium]MDE2168480.1 DUF952 domain-containing protein [Sphingomonadales bacterium]